MPKKDQVFFRRLAFNVYNHREGKWDDFELERPIKQNHKFLNLGIVAELIQQRNNLSLSRWYHSQIELILIMRINSSIKRVNSRTYFPEVGSRSDY